MKSRAKIVTLLSDFGYQDAYVGVMKGVILGISPNVSLIDLTHGIPPGRPVAVIGGFDRLEVSINGGSAADSLGGKIGGTIRVNRQDTY